TVLYDEVIFVIEGCFELRVGDELFEVRPGQLLWIPDGTELVYGGYALFGYVVHPGNWKELHDLG
ncbi:MAG: ethanolamine utilization protein EutQ, partial [Pseudomonas sp.]